MLDFSKVKVKTRAEYEATCRTFSVRPHSDSEIRKSYGIRFGQWNDEEHGRRRCLEMTLAQQRSFALDREQKAAPWTATSMLPEEIQLWEPCEICGAEPVGADHLCARHSHVVGEF